MKKILLALFFSLIGILFLTPKVFVAVNGPYTITLNATTTSSSSPFTLDNQQTVYILVDCYSGGQGWYIRIKQNSTLISPSSSNFWNFGGESYGYTSGKGFYSYNLGPGQYTMEAYGGTGAFGYGNITATLKYMKYGKLIRILNNTYSLNTPINTTVYYYWSGQLFNGSVTKSASLTISNANISGGSASASGQFAANTSTTYNVTLDGGCYEIFYPSYSKTSYLAYVDIWYDVPLPDVISNIQVENATTQSDGKIWTHNKIMLDWKNSITSNRTYKILENSTEIPYQITKQDSSGNYAVLLYPTTGNFNPGNHTINIKAIDNYGNSVLSQPFTFVIDDAPPSINITSPLDNSTIGGNGTVTVIATATDSQGYITKVEFYIDGVLQSTVTAAPYSYSFSVWGGKHTITAIAYDRAALTGNAIINVSVLTHIDINSVNLLPPITN